MSHDENSSLEVAMAPTNYLLWLSKSNLWLSAIFRYPILNLADTLIMGHNLWLKGPGIWSLAQTCFGGSSDRESGTTGHLRVHLAQGGRFAKVDGLEIKNWTICENGRPCNKKLDDLLKWTVLKSKSHHSKAWNLTVFLQNGLVIFTGWVHFWTKPVKSWFL